MRKYIGISAIALSAAIAVSPASAIDLGVSASSSVNLSTPATTPTVSVDTGAGIGATVSTSNGVNVDVTSSPSSTSVNVDTTSLGLDTGDTVDLVTNDGDGVGVDLNGSGDPDDVSLGLDGNGNDAIVDLFGDTGSTPAVGVNRPARTTVNTETDDALVDLFGDGNSPAAAVALPVDDGLVGNDVGVGELDLDGVLGADVIPDLFGDGGGTDVLPDVGEGNGADLPSMALGDIPNLFGGKKSGTPSTPAAVGTPDAPGASGVMDPGEVTGPEGTDVDGTQVAVTDDGNDGGSTTVLSTTTPGVRGTTTVRGNAAIAAPKKVAASANTKCFTPSDDQIDHLLQSHEYSDSTVASWQNVGQIQLVPVQLCPDARVKVSEVSYDDANMGRLRSAIEQSDTISAQLEGVGRGPDDVLAVAEKDGELNVYVY